jgi:thiol-disulfide isomerase/thioredoxin
MLNLSHLFTKTLLIVALFGITTSTSGCFSSGTESDPNMAGLREISRTEFPTVQGSQEALANYRGKIVLLHFFASWCAECAAEIPTLRNLNNSFKGSDFQIVGVAIDDDPFDAQSFVRQFGVPFPVILDAQGDLKNYFSIKDLPVTLFLDRKGVPVTFQDPQTGSYTAKLIGGRRWDTERPVEMIAGMIEAK